MNVFTTVFLAHPLNLDLGRTDQANDPIRDGLDFEAIEPGDFEQTLRERISVFESSTWFMDSVESEIEDEAEDRGRIPRRNVSRDRN